MTNFERIAIFTLVENIEAQLRGLKTLIAASANQTPVTHKTTSTLTPDGQELSDDEEERLANEIERAREAHITKMTRRAETAFQGEWEKQAQAMTTLDDV